MVSVLAVQLKYEVSTIQEITT